MTSVARQRRITRSPRPAPAGAALWLLASLPLAVTVAAQETAPDQVIGQAAKKAEETPPPVETTKDPSQETDVSEDNYRRFMELDDRQLERRPFPVTGYGPRTGLTKVEQLPEASQKHLRNQLRGLISARGAWTPTERDRPYPFVPSAAARNDANLLRQEAEAWSELVAEYHDREEAIRRARSGGQDGSSEQTAGQERQQAQAQAQAQGKGAEDRAQAGGAAAPGDPSDGPSNSGSGADGAGQGSDSQTASTRQAASADPRRTALPPPDTATAPETLRAPSDEGVEQSAADYLRERGLAVDENPITAPSTAAPPPGDPGRWGEQAQSLLPPPAEAATDGDEASATAFIETATAPGRGSASAGARNEAGGGNVLTLEELLQVRGVGQEDPDDDPEDGASASPPPDGD